MFFIDSFYLEDLLFRQVMPYQLHSREAVDCKLRYNTHKRIVGHSSRYFPMIGVPDGSLVSLVTTEVDVIGSSPAGDSSLQTLTSRKCESAS